MIPLPPTVLSAFRLSTRAPGAVPWGTGHIHETFRVDPEGTGPRVLLQRVNDAVFPDPRQLGESIRRTTQHLRAKLEAAGVPELNRRVLSLLPTAAGAYGQIDEEGHWWRAFAFIEGAHSLRGSAGPEAAHGAARAFGRFQRALIDLPPPRLPETLPGFHDTHHRFASFQRAVEANPAGRAAAAAREIAFARTHEGIAGRLLEAYAAGRIPERITHGDAKLDNLLFDDATNEPLCVVDLDTVMPGLTLYDFGDLVRTAACRAAEDEQDLQQVGIDTELFGALAAGYLEAMGSQLTETEEDLLVFSGRLITLETGLRFLTDHLQGDIYFKTQRPEQNLERARTQFALVRSLEEHAPDLEAIVRRLL